MNGKEPLASASREIRAPRSHVFHRAADVASSLDWLWDRRALPEISGESTRPDGSRRLTLTNGEQLQVRVLSRDEPGRLEIQTQHKPSGAGKDQPGRVLNWLLELENGPGTTRASLRLFREGAAPVAVRVDPRARAVTWQRNCDASLDRLVSLCEPRVEEKPDASAET